MNLQHYFRVRPFHSIKIELERKDKDSKQCDSYTTGDIIEGLVWIQTYMNLRPQDVEVIFCGRSFCGGLTWILRAN